MKQVYFGLLNFVAGSLCTLLIVGQLAFRQDNHHEEDKANYEWKAPAVPAQLYFAGETVPLDKWDVKERLDRELLYNYYYQANILFLLKMSNRYFPIISRRLKANGVPDDFKYLCVAESNLVSTALSRSGAVSYWQFLNKTAPGYGLTVNSEVDDRYNLEKATDAACIYFKRSYEKLGSWTAAAASFNCGQNGYYRRAVQQQTTDYYSLQLPEETQRYIFRILAFKQLLENAEKYGFSLPDEEKYQPIPHRTITVNYSIPNLTGFAIKNGTTYKMLRKMNPWLRGNSLTIKNGKTYKIKLPVD